ncbi:MAG: hypothetical protein JWM86_97, partial [Thermoleophilia bacterium]|nr:hypothetical protein [Thermoleophilia bacterium]
MQLASIASVSPVTPMRAPSPVVAGTPIAPRFAGIAAPSAPGTARDGAALLGLPPIVQFPGIVAGQAFDVVKGSKVGFLNVKGEANVLRMDPNAASFHVKAGAFGVKVDVQVDIV